MAISPRSFRVLAIVDLVALCLITASGAAVRLTGSGLGCPDWPNCTQHGFVAALGDTHAVIEDLNRFITVAVVVLTGTTVLAAWQRRPRRTDLVWLALGLVGGVVADALLGALVVYTKLNPWLVSGHTLLSLALIVTAGVLVHRAGHRYGDGARHEVRCAASLPVARWLWVALLATVLTGMATTGSGPHSGGGVGQLVARRLPFTLEGAAWVHSATAAAFLALVAGAYLALKSAGAARHVLVGAERLLVVGCAQGALGITQFATHLPIALVELHVIGAVSLTIGVLQFQLRQVARDPDVGLVAGAPSVAGRRDARPATQESQVPSESGTVAPVVSAVPAPFSDSVSGPVAQAPGSPS